MHNIKQEEKMARTKATQTESPDQNSQYSIDNAIEIFEEMDKNYSGFKSRKTVIDCIDTGSPSLNKAIGIGGIPRGRLVQVFGPQGAGKSFLVKNWVKQAALADPNSICVWFDAEHSFNYVWAEKMGIWNKDPKKSRIRVIPGTKGVDIIERIVGKIAKDKFGTKKTRNGILDYVKEGKINCPLIVIDSLGAIVAPREEDSPVGGITVGALAMFLTAELKRMSGILEESNVCLTCINQVRQSIDAGKYGEQFHFPGGENLKHQMSLNLYVEKRNGMDDVICEKEKDRDTLIGQKVKIVVKKNRFAPVPRSCETTFLFKEGAGYDTIGIVNTEYELIDLAVSCGIMTRGGAWYNYGDLRFQGEKKIVEFLKENPNNLKELSDKVKAANIISQPDGIEEIFEDIPTEEKEEI